MTLLVLHHTKGLGGWVTSTSMSRQCPAEGVGQKTRAGHSELNVSFTRSEGMPSTRLLQGADAEATDRAFQCFSKESV